MRTVARNTLLPLLLVLPVLAYCLFLAIDTTTNFPEKMLPSAIPSAVLCLITLALMILSLSRNPRREALLGALAGSGVGVIAAVNGAYIGIMLLANGARGGKDGAAQILPFTLPFLALLVLAPLLLGLGFGAKIAQRNADRGEAQSISQEGTL